MAKTRIAVVGASGRLGSKIVELAQLDPFKKQCEITLKIGSKNQSELFSAKNFDAVIDVSLPEPTSTILGQFLKKKISVPYVVGCTGWTSAQTKILDQYAKQNCALFCPNFSLGITVLVDVLEKTANLFKSMGFEATILDIHHNKKKDAPSGTAKALEKPISDLKPQVASFRAGNIVGIHEVQFFSAMESLSFRHEAYDRGVFAFGALQAALWASKNGKKAGLFSMKDVLGL
jgi:4-hydroxy-tetrahydrodipicolinate reductase